MKCANPNCNREFTPNTVRQKYCDIICSDKAQHAKARDRARLGRLSEAYKREHTHTTTQTEANNKLEEQRLRRVHEQRMREEEAAALRDVFGYEPKRPANIEVPDTGIDKDEANEGKLKLEDI